MFGNGLIAVRKHCRNCIVGIKKKSILVNILSPQTRITSELQLFSSIKNAPIFHQNQKMHARSQPVIKGRRSGWKSCSIKLNRVLVISCFPAVEKFYCFNEGCLRGGGGGSKSSRPTAAALKERSSFHSFVRPPPVYAPHVAGRGAELRIIIQQTSGQPPV